MRDVVDRLSPLDADMMREALGGEATLARHDALAARMSALRQIEAVQPVKPVGPPPERVRIAAWNLERCTAVEASATLLRQAGIAIALLSEMDCGMARSGNRHTTRDLAGELGAGHLFGIEFVELGLGFGHELVAFAGETNAASLHGNAIVSALPFRDPFQIPLDGGGAWFGLDWHHRRIGGRMAIGATVELKRGPVVLVSTHLENRSTPEERRIAMARMIAGLDAVAPGLPAVVAGDLNVATLPDPASEPDLGWFARPDGREPLFAVMREAGFDWQACNTPDQTRRHVKDGRRAPWTQRIDWFFTRGLAVSTPMTRAAADPDGAPLSDHEMITVEIG